MIGESDRDAQIKNQLQDLARVVVRDTSGGKCLWAVSVDIPLALREESAAESFEVLSTYQGLLHLVHKRGKI